MVKPYEMKGFDSFNRKFEQFNQKLHKDLETVVNKEGQLFRGALVDRITNNIRPHRAKRGKLKGKAIYRVVTDLVDTGFLRASWQVKKITSLEVEVTSNVKYGPVLEYGTRDGKRKGFFFVRDTVKDRQGKFTQSIQGAYDRNVSQ